MGRHSTIPDLYDDCKTISITALKRWGYLDTNNYKSGNITWSRGDRETGKIGIAVKMNEDGGTLTLNYICDKEPVNNQVEIISKRANIGNGRLWFFVCPQTGKPCRKLYLGNKYFLHRSTFRGYMYELQTWSNNTRHLLKTPMYLEIKADNIYEQIYTKHFKKYYNGKPTKRYVSLLKKIRKRPETGIIGYILALKCFQKSIGYGKR